MWSYPSNLALILFQAMPQQPGPSPSPPAQTGETAIFLWLVFGIVLGIGIGILLSLAFRKSQGRRDLEQPAITTSIAPPPASRREAPRRKKAGEYVQRCPACNSTYTDEELKYCVSDGTTLVRVSDKSPAYDSEATMLYPETRRE